MPLKQLFLKFFKKISSFLIVIFSYFLTLSTLLFIKNYFIVSEIEVYGPTDIKGLNFISEKILPFLREKELQERLMNTNYKIKEIKIIKHYPNKIKIFASITSPIAILNVEGGYLILSEDGRVLERSRLTKDDFPMISFYQKIYFSNFTVGERIGFNEIIHCLFFLEKFNYLGIKIKTIDIKGPDMIILNSEDKKFIFTVNKDKEIQYQELKAILSRLKLEKIEFEVIDFRFQQPILKLK